MNTVSVGSVFCHRQGTLYRSFRTALERAVRKAGVGDFTLHDLRHTLASRLVIVGGHLPTIQDLMGHKNISISVAERLTKASAWYPWPREEVHHGDHQAMGAQWRRCPSGS